jgi:glycosyltransferase involved in cell wall biosynthesis
MSTPELSVIMTVWNSAQTIMQSIQSILDQSFPHFEFIIVDDGSTDESSRIIRAIDDKRIRYVRREENLGQTESLNQALSLAKAPLVARQDGDDISHFQRLEYQTREFYTDAKLSLLGTQGVVCNAMGRITGLLSMPITPEDVEAWFLIDNPIIHASAMFRKEIVLDQADGYNTSFQICQDYDLWSRVRSLGKIRNLTERLVAYRISGTSLSHGANEKTKKEAAIVRNRLSSEPNMKGRRLSLRGHALKILKGEEKPGLREVVWAVVCSPRLLLATAWQSGRFCGKDVDQWRRSCVADLIA